MSTRTSLSRVAAGAGTGPGTHFAPVAVVDEDDYDDDAHGHGQEENEEDEEDEVLATSHSAVPVQYVDAEEDDEGQRRRRLLEYPLPRARHKAKATARPKSKYSELDEILVQAQSPDRPPPRSHRHHRHEQLDDDDDEEVQTLEDHGDLMSPPNGFALEHEEDAGFVGQSEEEEDTVAEAASGRRGLPLGRVRVRTHKDHRDLVTSLADLSRTRASLRGGSHELDHEPSRDAVDISSSDGNESAVYRSPEPGPPQLVAEPFLPVEEEEEEEERRPRPRPKPRLRRKRLGKRENSDDVEFISEQQTQAPPLPSHREYRNHLSDQHDSSDYAFRRAASPASPSNQNLQDPHHNPLSDKSPSSVHTASFLQEDLSPIQLPKKRGRKSKLLEHQQLEIKIDDDLEFQDHHHSHHPPASPIPTTPPKASRHSHPHLHHSLDHKHTEPDYDSAPPPQLPPHYNQPPSAATTTAQYTVAEPESPPRKRRKPKQHQHRRRARPLPPPSRTPTPEYHALSPSPDPHPHPQANHFQDDIQQQYDIEQQELEQQQLQDELEMSYEQAQDELVNHIIYDLQPPEFAEKAPFLRYHPHHHPDDDGTLAAAHFSAAAVRDRVNALYDHHQADLFDQLQETLSRVSLSLRVFECTSGSGEVSFLEIFVHWLDQGMVHHVRLLDFWCIPHNETTADFLLVLSAAVYRTLVKFGIEYRVFAITLDRAMAGSGPQSFLRQLKACYPRGDASSGSTDGPKDEKPDAPAAAGGPDSAHRKPPEVHVVYSLSLTLDGIANQFLERMNAQAWPASVWYNFSLQAGYVRLDRASTVYDHPVAALRVIIQYFESHPQDWADVCGGSSGGNGGGAPIALDVYNDWLSTHEMLRAATKYQAVIDRATDRLPALQHCRITGQEWARIKNIRQFLHILRKFKGYANDFHPQFNLYAMILWKIQVEHSDVRKRAKPYDKFATDVCDAFVKACDQYPWIFDTEQWPHLLPFFGSMLDPRQRTAIIADSMSQSAASEWKIRLISYAKKHAVEVWPPLVDEDPQQQPVAIDVEDDGDSMSESDELHRSNGRKSADRADSNYETDIAEDAIFSPRTHARLAVASTRSSPGPAPSTSRRHDSPLNARESPFAFARSAAASSAHYDPSAAPSAAASASESDDDDIKILDEKMVLGAPLRTVRADLHDYFAESLVPYDSLLHSDVVMAYWLDASVHPEFARVAREVLAVATGAEESARWLLGSAFDGLVANRWDQVGFEWLRRLVFLRGVLSVQTSAPGAV